MKYNFKKLIKPKVVNSGDVKLNDVIESLALFYDPALMSEYADSLLINSDLQSIFNACLKTKNMSFVKAYSSLLHNRIKAYAVMDKCHIKWSKDELNGAREHYNYTMYTNLNRQYRDFLFNLTSEGSKFMYEKICDVVFMICSDIEAGITYDNINAYLTLLNGDYDEVLYDIESFLTPANQTNSDDCDNNNVVMYAKMYNEIEGNLNCMHDIVWGRTFNSGIKNTDDLLRAMCDDYVTYGRALAESMMFHIHGGITPFQNTLQILDECNTYIEEDGGIPVEIPSHLITDLRECLQVVRKWLAQGVAMKLKWRSMIVSSSDFSRVPVISIGDDNELVETTKNVRDLLAKHLESLLKDIPSIYGALSESNKLDVLKVVADAIDVKVTNDVKTSMWTLSSFANKSNFNPTEEVYFRAWTTEIYRALQDVINVTNYESMVNDTYRDLKNYKNTNEN